MQKMVGVCVDTLIHDTIFSSMYWISQSVDGEETTLTEGAGILIMARTDARCISMDEAIIRCQEFRKAGADITFLVSVGSSLGTAGTILCLESAA